MASSDSLNPCPAGRLPPLRLFLASLIVTVGVPFHYGYQLTWISPAENALLHFVNQSVTQHYEQNLDRIGIETIWGASVALFFAGAIPGAILMQMMADYFGRKPIILVSNAAFTLCCAVDGAAKFMLSIELFALFRFLIGFWSIVGIGVSSVFLTECSPKHCRGAIGMTTSSMVQLGSIIGAIVAMPQIFGDQHNWWLIFMAETAILALSTVSLFALHESPSFLLSRDREAEAVQSLEFYHGKQSPAVLAAILDELHLELRCNSHPLGMIAVWRVRKTPIIRRALWVGIVLGACMSFCGVAVIDAYLVKMLHHKIGFSVQFASIAYVGMQILGLISNIVSAFTVDHIGRRPLMIFSFSAMFFTNVFFSCLLYANTTASHSPFLNVALVVAVFVFCPALCCGLLPLYMFVTTEMVGQNARSTTQAWARLVDSITRFSVLAAYPPVANLIGIGQAYALFFLPILGISGLFLYFAMPETKNRNLMEVEAEVEQLLKSSMFPKRKNKIGDNSQI